MLAKGSDQLSIVYEDDEHSSHLGGLELRSMIHAPKGKELVRCAKWQVDLFPEAVSDRWSM